MTTSRLRSSLPSFALAASFFLGLLAACSENSPPAVDSELARLKARAERVTIIRDDFGVPHIYAATDVWSALRAGGR